MFTVTFCAMDYSLMWHACVLLSRSDAETQKLEVVNTWGFYGVPSIEDYSFTKTIKKSLGLEVAFSGSHGKWRHEDIRYLDRGKHLHGRTFELTEEQFLALEQHFINLEKEENEAIEEIASFLQLKPKADHKIYAYEDYGAFIFSIEKAKANASNREPRLHSFELNFSLDWWGPHLRNAHTCKSEAIVALRNAHTNTGSILNKGQIDELTVSGKHPSFPRFSGTKMEDIRLHSSGPLSTHTKKSGEKIYFRDKDGVRVFWTLPPQNIDFLTDSSQQLGIIKPEQRSKVINLITQLQSLEWVLYNSSVEQHYKQDFTAKLVKVYEAFATIHIDNNKLEEWQKKLMYSFFASEQSIDELELKKKIDEAKNLLNTIHITIKDLKKPVISILIKRINMILLRLHYVYPMKIKKILTLF